MTTNKARKAAVRDRMAATGEPYSVAARALRGQAGAGTGSATAVIDPALLVPYPDEAGVTVEELGWRVLPASATAQQRAHAEAVWRPVLPDRACRCSGPCEHGAPCPEEVLDDNDQAVSCGGRLIHSDRYPGSLFSVIVWEDTYHCHSCGVSGSASVELPAIPWGEVESTDTPDGPRSTTLVYSGVRHPNFADEDTPEYPEGDGSCRGCGGYALSGLLCDGCRAEGWTDAYGMIGEPDPDENREECFECGASGPYGCNC
jgi:hypothetical protein